MDANPFAEMPPTPDPVIASVHDRLCREYEEGRCPTQDDLARLAEEVVCELWDAPVKTFVPILALRRAREVLLARVEEAPPPVDGAGPRTPVRAARRPADDVMLLDGRDVLRVG